MTEWMYIIVTAETVKELEQEVNKAMKVGYTLQGQPFVVELPTYTLAQAMVLRHSL